MGAQMNVKLPKRLEGWSAKIEQGKVGFKELEQYALKLGEVRTNESGRQELLENLINEFI